MFGRIAKRYDLLNRLMTLGCDRAWRRETVQHLSAENTSLPGGLYLDAGCGTGDLSFELLAQNPDAEVIAADLTPEMIAEGRKRKGAEKIAWVIADGQHLPFSSSTFSGVVSGYLLRNVADLERTLGEQRRVLVPGGKMAALDTTRPRDNLLRPFILLYFKWGIPLMGKIIARDAAAYSYLPETSARFLEAETLAERMRSVGFLEVGFTRRMLGTMAIHWAKKSAG
jgi:demethylmenaquinone methyltransferase/2-methoxy-6-polyprenyl-1,4-benzoquinol methylase